MTNAQRDALIAYYRVGIDGLVSVKGKTIKALIDMGYLNNRGFTPEGKAFAKYLSDREHEKVVGMSATTKRKNPKGGEVLATVWSYDVWGNAKVGYEVNDRSKFGEFTTYRSVLEQNKGVLRFLKDIGFLKKSTQLRQLEIEGDDMTIYVNAAKDSYPLCGIDIES